jgi:hypothetical protein
MWIQPIQDAFLCSYDINTDICSDTQLPILFVSFCGFQFEQKFTRFQFEQKFTSFLFLKIKALFTCGLQLVIYQWALDAFDIHLFHYNTAFTCNIPT